MEILRSLGVSPIAALMRAHRDDIRQQACEDRPRGHPPTQIALIGRPAETRDDNGASAARRDAVAQPDRAQ
jgi:hypothetical protein